MAETKEVTVAKKPKNLWVYRMIGVLFALYLGTIWLIIGADAKIVWLPWDVIPSAIADIQYYRANPAKSVPEASALSSKLPVEGFIEKQFIPVLELINREPQFKYLVDMVVKYKIPIIMGKAEEFNGWENMAHYVSACPGKPIGKVVVNPSNTSTNINRAGIFVHELTHAYDKINKPNYYCTGKQYLSLELNAFKKEDLFRYQYDHFAFLGLWTGGEIDLRGNLNDYCIYYTLKNTPIYSSNIDDVKLSPSPGSNEEIICRISSIQ